MVKIILFSALLASSLIASILPLQTASAQSAVHVSDEHRRFLDVRKRQIDLNTARAALQRTQDLAKQGLLPQIDLERAKTAVEMAQLNYQEAVLSLLSIQPRLSVREAIKSQDKEGRKHVKLTVENLSPTIDDSQFRLLNDFDGADPLPESLRTREIKDVFISLRAAGDGGNNGTSLPRGTTIALPYEIHIRELKYGAAARLNFQLLRDVSSVIVTFTYKGQIQETVIELQRAETEYAVGITTTQISQEADLGSHATFDLKLERSSVDVRQLQVRVVNLPHQVNYSFIDPVSQARLSQISFPAGIIQQSLGLRIFLPERADEHIRVDEPLEFWALAMDEAQANLLHGERAFSAGEIEQSRAGKVRLVVIPRGVGRIEASAASLFSEIVIGEAVETNITIRNTGTRRLDNIKLSAEYPLGWRAELEPDIVQSLDINRESNIQLKILPPHDILVGDYEVRIKTESFAYNRRVPSEDKVYRISIKAQANMWVTAGLVALLLALILGIVIFGIRLMQR